MLERCPEGIRTVLKVLLGDLKSKESLTGIGLFGSWSRADAEPSSDVDLLIVDKRCFEYSYVERAEIGNNLLDLEYVPAEWVLPQIRPELDQKLYEAQILYDRTGALERAKEMMLRIYSSPERVEIRAGNCLIEADTYISRAASAYDKKDFQSSKANAGIAFEAALRIFVDAAMLPFSNSRFIRASESATKKFGVRKLYDDYLVVAGLAGLDVQRTGRMLDSVLAMWKVVMSYVQANSSTVGTLHVRAMNALNYYGKESFLKGFAARTSALIKDGLFAEAAHYMVHTSASLLENYACLVSVVEKTRFDFTSLFRLLRDSQTSPCEVYRKAVDAFGLEKVTGREAEESLEKTKETVLAIRRKRGEIIARLPPEHRKG